MLAGELRVPHGRYYLVAEDDGRVAGYAGLLAGIRRAYGGQADVLTMAVAEDRWGQGIGPGLLEGLLAEADRRGTRARLPRGARRQRPGAAPTAVRVHRDRAQAGLLPALRH